MRINQTKETYMTDNLLTPEIETEENTTMKPDALPEKFWDAETGEIRLDELIKSYIALEKKLSAAPRVPATPEEYCVNCDHGLFVPDIGLNKHLHERGFTAEQVQTVYDLAAERLVPMIVELAGEYRADRELDRLAAAFGGAEKWQEISRQLLAFGRKNLPADVLDNLSSSFEGVMMLYRMMKGESGLATPRIQSEASLNESDLRSMMRDPKYWREKDPSFVTRVTEGFRSLYGH
jgi:hypothetical protein